MVSSMIVAALVFAGGSDCPGNGLQHKNIKVAWLGTSPENTYDDANFQGAKKVGKQLNAKVTPFYSNFDPALQLAQCKSVVKSGKYDALLVIAASQTGIIPCVTLAKSKGIPVVAVELPIGPDSTTTEPQVPGQTGAVLTPSVEFANALDSLVVDACEGVSPCRLLYLAGYYSTDFDLFALAELEDLIAENPNLELVGAPEAFYDPATAYSIVEGLLADGVALDLVIGAGDQMAMGAEWAIADAGVPQGQILISGGGASEYGVDAVRDGRWYGTFVTLPYDEGEIAVEMAVRAARKQWIPDRSIDAVELAGLPRVMTTQNLDQFVGFTGQWPG